MKLTDANKIRDYVKEQINPYGKPFDGSAYEFGLKLIKYLENLSTDYDVDKVVEELEKSSKWVNETNEYGDDDGNDYIPLSKTLEIVKQGDVSDDVC